jgi:hypothetical protein
VKKCQWEGYGLGFEMKNMRFFAFLILASALLAFAGCQNVQKPEIKGQGPLAVVMDRGTATAEYHAPLERWRAAHKQALNDGDFTERECVLCHNPQKSCNHCHAYVGAKEISIPEASLYWPDSQDEAAPRRGRNP